MTAFHPTIEVTFKTPVRGVTSVKCNHVESASVWLSGKEYPIMELHFSPKVIWEVDPLNILHLYPVNS